MRSNRRGTQLSLRRKAREQHIKQRVRKLSSQNPAATASQSHSAQPTVDQIPKYVANAMQSESLERRLSGVRSLRELLSRERNPPSERVAQSGVVPVIVALLDDHENADIQCEAAWCVTNLASSTSSTVTQLVELGAIEKSVAMFRHHIARRPQNEETLEMAIWALGNISGENKAMCSRMVATGFIESLVSAMPALRRSSQGIAVWTISNVTRTVNPLPRPLSKRLVPAMKQLLRDSRDPRDSDVVSHILWTLCYLSSSGGDSLCRTLSMMVEDAVAVLAEESNKFQRALSGPNGAATVAANVMDHSLYKPALRFLGNILSGTDELTQCVLDAGYLDVIRPFVDHLGSAQKKEMIWSLSNILAGSPVQIEALLNKQHLVVSIIRAANDGTLAVKKEAAWCLGNATVDATQSQIKRLAEFGSIEALCGMLKPSNEITDRFVRIIVEALDAFLRVHGTSGFNPYLNVVEECGGLDFLEDRQADCSLSEDTYDGIVNLMKKYWNEDVFGNGGAEEFALRDQQRLTAVVDDATNTFKFGCGAKGGGQAAVGQNGLHCNGGPAMVYRF